MKQTKTTIALKFSLILLIGTIFMAKPLWVSAESTPFEATSSSAAKDSIKERIQKVVKENSDKIKGVIDSLSQRKRGFIGQVERVTAENITIKSVKGSEILSIDDNVELTKAGKAINTDDVAVGDWMTVLGLQDDNDFVPLRIQVSSTTIRPKSYVLQIGSISEYTSKEITILTRAESEELSFTINRSTDYQDINAEAITASQVDEDAQVIILGYQDDTGHTATIIRSLTAIAESN